MARLNAGLLGAGFTKLGVKLDDIFLIARQRFLQVLQLFTQMSFHVGNLGLLNQRTFCKVVPAFGDGEFRLLLPFGLRFFHLGDPTLDIFLIRNRFGRRRAYLNKRVFHFLDDHADDFFRVFRLVENCVDVRVDDVGQSGKNTHFTSPFLCSSLRVPGGFRGHFFGTSSPILHRCNLGHLFYCCWPLLSRWSGAPRTTPDQR